MNEKIKLILSLSISGSILAGIIFGIKPLIKHKLSKSFQYYIWLVVLLRLVIPFSFETSIMNKMFYSNSTPTVKTTQGNTITAAPTVGNISIPINNQEITNGDNAIQPLVTAKSIDIKALLKNNILFIWMLGVLISFASNLWGYARFMKYLKIENKPPREEENQLLKEMLNGRQKVLLVRNKFTATPMLIGILRPRIVIPDIDYTHKQLENILLHEITHLRRFDIGVKWLTVIAASLHWFNPFMHFIKREISHACELSCDEGVIKNLNAEDKQEYGDTLIDLVADNKYSIGILSITMCEEKRTLKERLLSIMNHTKKSRNITIISAVLIALAICTSVVLGAGIGFGNKKPPNIYISSELQKTKNAIMGGYSWKNGREYILTDTDHPKNFEYKNENIVSAKAKEQIIIGTQKIKRDKKYSFSIEKLEVYKDGKLIEFDSQEPSYINGSLYLQTPAAAGEYTYCLLLNFKDKGTVNYGFAVRVDMATYDLTEIEKYRTPYIGNNSKVGGIVRLLPLPNSYFMQQYISMQTSARPYKLNVYYEGIINSWYNGEWPISSPDSIAYVNMQKNALVLYCMIDNLEDVTFSFRDTPSNGTLDTSKYKTHFTFSKESIEYEYGDIEKLSSDLGLLSDALNGKKIVSIDEIDKLLSIITSSPMASSNPSDYIAEHRVEYDRLVNMSQDALPHLNSILAGGDWELKGNIVQRICTDIIKELNKSGDISAKSDKLIKETNDVINNWQLVLEYYKSKGISPSDPLPEFTKDEVASARGVVEKYYRGILAKDDKVILSTLHDRTKSENMELYGTEKRTLLRIDYDSQDIKRRNYRPNDIAFTSDKVIVFRVSFNIEYPNGIGGPWSTGMYDDWCMILTRENENSTWFIYDQGY
jgi:beta-lactamase regulating signal transducer with metallopeptidase domain